MCDPVSASIAAAAAVASAGGGIIQAGAQNKAAKTQARADAGELRAQTKANAASQTLATREQQRQIGLSNEAAPIFDRGLPEYGRPATDARMGAATDRRMATINATTPQGMEGVYLPGQLQGSSITRNAIADRVAEARAKLAGQALARARLGSWGDAFQGLSERTQPLMDQAGQISSFKAGSASVLPVEQNAVEARQGAENIAAGAPLGSLFRTQQIGGMGSLLSGAGSSLATLAGSGAAKAGSFKGEIAGAGNAGGFKG
jgi:hypothetical protein